MGEKFELVLGPLLSVQALLGSISDSALGALNQATASNSAFCPFADTYTKDTITSPWSLGRLTETTPYVIRTGSPTSYDRMGSEDGETYLGRIYDKAGCDVLKNGVIEGYRAVLQLYNVEMAMTADLGVSCPTDKADFDDTCPTQEFQSRYANLTLVGLLEDYKGKITGTKDSLVNLASTSVGDTMLEVEDFLCNMNVSFVERRYDEVKHDICVTLFGGVTQINLALWLLGLSLEMVAVLAHVLSVRLRGLSRKEAACLRHGADIERIRPDVYG